MQFDPFKWEELSSGKANEAPKGLLHIMSTEAISVLVTCQGHEALAGVGTEVKVQIAEDFTYTIFGPKTARCFVKKPPKVYHKPSGEVFTNADRLPTESGTVLEVKRALRQLQIQQSTYMRENKLAQMRKRAERKKDAPSSKQKEEKGDAPDKGEQKPHPVPEAQANDEVK